MTGETKENHQNIGLNNAPILSQPILDFTSRIKDRVSLSVKNSQESRESSKFGELVEKEINLEAEKFFQKMEKGELTEEQGILYVVELCKKGKFEVFRKILELYGQNTKEDKTQAFISIAEKGYLKDIIYDYKEFGFDNINDFKGFILREDMYLLENNFECVVTFLLNNDIKIADIMRRVDIKTMGNNIEFLLGKGLCLNKELALEYIQLSNFSDIDQLFLILSKINGLDYDIITELSKRSFLPLYLKSEHNFLPIISKNILDKIIGNFNDDLQEILIHSNKFEKNIFDLDFLINVVSKIGWIYEYKHLFIENGVIFDKNLLDIFIEKGILSKESIVSINLSIEELFKYKFIFNFRDIHVGGNMKGLEKYNDFVTTILSLENGEAILGNIQKNNLNNFENDYKFNDYFLQLIEIDYNLGIKFLNDIQLINEKIKNKELKEMLFKYYYDYSNNFLKNGHSNYLLQIDINILIKNEDNLIIDNNFLNIMFKKLLNEKEYFEEYIDVIKEYEQKGLHLFTGTTQSGLIHQDRGFLFFGNDIQICKEKLSKLYQIQKSINNDEIFNLIFNIINEETINYTTLYLLKLYLKKYDSSQIIIYLYETQVKDIGYIQENWDIITMIYSKIEINEDDKIPTDIKESINQLIKENKNDIYGEIKSNYIKFLETQILTEDMKIFLEVIEKNGLGNLSQSEILTNFLGSLQDLSKQTLSLGPLEEILGGDFVHIYNQILKYMHSFEVKNFQLSNQDTTHFYAINNDILKISPELLNDYLELFELLNENETKYFIDNVYTLHNVLITFSFGIDNNGGKKEKFREEITKKILQDCKNGNIREKLEKNKTEIQNKIIEIAKNKFGIIKLPEILSEEIINDIKQFSIYYTNIANRNDDKIKMIGIALGLKLNGLWSKFRNLEEINFGEYFDEKTQEFAKNYREELIKLYSGITINGLQSEVSNTMTGSMETIDQRLLNIIFHIRESLTDKDAYPEETYKIFELYKKYGVKVGKVLALKYQSFTKEAKFDDETTTILSELGEIKTQEDVKNIQEKVDIVKGVVGINEDFTKIDIETPIKELNELLIPNNEIISLFEKLGENFNSESGAIALSQDILYLFDLVIKNKDKLTESEYTLGINYLNSIKNKLDSLYEYLFKIEDIFKTRFCEKQKGNLNGEKRELLVKNIYSKSPILKDRIEVFKNELLKSQSKDGANIEMITTFTNSLTEVISNIRGCLGCQKKEINNDTNLRFTASNEFFIISKKIGSSKSFADQPVSLLETDKGNMFILDTLRGESKNPDVIVAHILVILKKLKQIKRKDISILFPQSASGGVGITSEYIIKKLKEEINDSIEITQDLVNVVVKDQEYYDPHYEWGNIREKKNAVVNGMIISFK